LGDKGKNAFDLLAKPIRKLIAERGFARPTPPQEKAIPLILEGKNVLLIAPTATGKTEAAFLPVLHMLITMPERPRGIKVLYITPLRALNRDLLERLEWWCMRLDLKLAVRHGDTEQRERARQARSPPDVLITTPETLNAILLGRVMRRHLRSVRWIIIDELHEMVDCKRGSQLSLALERLRELLDQEPQVIGLSATVGSPEEAARFLVGNGRPVEVVHVPVARMMELKVLFPQATDEDRRLAEALYTHPEVAARLRVMKELLEEHESAIVFTNTRSIAEVLASRFRVWDLEFPISIHHGSLSKPSRVAAEKGLKNGELKALVATSSLELGIDVGRVELVVQYMSPRQVTRLVQRVGRAGHRLDRVAKGVIITMDSDDTLEAMAIARRALEEELEPLKIPECPLDALAHQIAGELIRRGRVYFYELYELFRRAYPYSKLTLKDIASVLEYMHNRYPRLAWVSEEDMVAIKPRRSRPLYEYYFGTLSMIPDEKHYVVVNEAEDLPVGLLDECFVAEYGRPGVKFVIRGRPWIITAVRGDRVYVREVEDPTGAIPNWVGEEIPVPFEVAQEVGQIRAFVEEQIRNGAEPEEIARCLAEKYPTDFETALRAIRETVEHVRLGYPAPTHKRILVEEWDEYVIIHAHFGSLTNRTLAQLIGQLAAERIGLAVLVQHDPYRIIMHTRGELSASDVAGLIAEASRMDPEAVRDAVRRAVVRTGIFKRRLIHVAQRFGALEKWADLSSVSMKSLVKSFEGTAIYEEALKEVFTFDLDVEHLLQVLSAIRSGGIEVLELQKPMGEITPIAYLGVERMSMKTDVIPPERLRRILVEATRARLLSEARVLVCTSCWGYVATVRAKDLPDHPTCPRCGSRALGVLNEDEDVVCQMAEKAAEGASLTRKERWLMDKALETARLVEQYGKPAFVALCGKGLGVRDAKWVLGQEARLTERFYERVMEAERRSLMARFRR